MARVLQQVKRIQCCSSGSPICCSAPCIMAKMLIDLSQATPVLPGDTLTVRQYLYCQAIRQLSVRHYKDCQGINQLSVRRYKYCQATHRLSVRQETYCRATRQLYVWQSMYCQAIYILSGNTRTVREYTYILSGRWRQSQHCMITSLHDPSLKIC